MECPSVSFSQKGSASRNKQDFLCNLPSWGGWILTSPLLEQHGVIHSHMRNWDGLKQDTPSTSLGRSWIQAVLGGRCCYRALGEAPALGPAQPMTHISSQRREPRQEIWVVLKYLLMEHHLIPGVSGMSGRLCNLLRRGGPARAPACCTLRLAETEPCTAPTHPVHLAGHCRLHRERARME